MKPEEIEWCNSIHKKIANKKIYEVLFTQNIPLKLSRPIAEIEKLLLDGKYLSVFDWALDINSLAFDILNNDTDPMHLLIVQDFRAWFEKKLANKAISKEEKDRKTLMKCLEKVKIIAEAYDNAECLLKACEMSKDKVPVFKKKYTPEELEKIQNDINNITNPELLNALIRLIKKWKPNCDVKEDTVIKIDELPKQFFYEMLILIKNFK